MTEFGPLEYIVLGFESGQFTNKVLPELNTLQKSGLIRVRDLVFIDKDVLESVSIQEISDLEDDDQAAYVDLADDLTGLLTEEDIERLTREIPAGSQAVLVLFEHCWTLPLASAVQKANGVIFAGGMVSHESWRQVRAELTAKEESHA